MSIHENTLALCLLLILFLNSTENTCVSHNHLKEFSIRCNLPSFPKVILSLNNFNEPAVENQCYLKRKRHGKFSSLNCIRMDCSSWKNYLHICIVALITFIHQIFKKHLLGARTLFGTENTIYKDILYTRK